MIMGSPVGAGDDGWPVGAGYDGDDVDRPSLPA